MERMDKSNLVLLENEKLKKRLRELKSENSELKRRLGEDDDNDNDEDEFGSVSIL